MCSRQFCRGRGRSRRREVEAEARQGSNVLNRGEARQRPRQRARGRGEADKTRGKAEAKQSEIDVVCHFDIMHNAHVVVTCSCFVVSDIYQWKTLQRSFIKSISNTRLSQDRGRNYELSASVLPRLRTLLPCLASASTSLPLPRQNCLGPIPALSSSKIQNGDILVLANPWRSTWKIIGVKTRRENLAYIYLDVGVS